MTMSTNPIGQRPQGVGISQASLSSGIGAPKSVFHVIEAKTFAIEYTDDGGVKHATLAMRIGGTWYLAPNGENYAATLKPAANWLSTQLDERVNITPTANGQAVPEMNVDVVGP